jgi:hypothetical protein
VDIAQAHRRVLIVQGLRNLDVHVGPVPLFLGGGATFFFVAEEEEALASWVFLNGQRPIMVTLEGAGGSSGSGRSSASIGGEDAAFQGTLMAAQSWKRWWPGVRRHCFSVQATKSA